MVHNIIVIALKSLTDLHMANIHTYIHTYGICAFADVPWLSLDMLS